MDVDGPVRDDLRVAPQVVEKPVPGQDAAAARGERVEDPELGGRQVEPDAIGHDLAAVAIDDEVVADLGPPPRASAVSPGPPEDGPHPRRELPGGEGLGQIVVGSHLQPQDAVRLGGPGGEHDHRDARPGLRPFEEPEDLEAVGPGKHQVEDHEVGGMTPEV